MTGVSNSKHFNREKLKPAEQQETNTYRNMQRQFFQITSLITFTVIVMLFSSCSKDETDSSTYYIRFNANGESVEFTNQLILIAGFGHSGNQYTGTISGANDAQSNVGLQIYNNAPILEGNYRGYGISGGAVVGVIIGYKEKQSGVLFSSGGGPNVDATVVITEITAATVKGTFHGKLQASGQPDMIITNGSFFVRRSN